MATNLTYNGVILHNVHTRQFEQTTIYDPSGTDQIAQKFRITVDGVIHIQNLSGMNGTENTAAVKGPWTALETGFSDDARLDIAAHQIRSRLAQPRGALLLQTDDPSNSDSPLTIIRCVPTTTSTLADPDRDVENGPKSQLFAITQIAGSHLYRVSFAIECTKLECGWSGYGDTTPKLISNRWSIGEAMDDNLFIVRTIQGNLKLSAGAWWDTSTGTPMKGGMTPHMVRGLVFPNLENGFRRDSFTFHANEDGLSASYIVVDRQIHTAAPWPATKMDCTHTESTAEGMTVFSDISVRLSGPPHADKNLMIVQAMRIANAKIRFKELTNTAKNRIVGASIVDHIGEQNAIELSLRVERIGDKPLEALGLDVAKMAKPLSSEDLPNDIGPAYDPVKSLIPYHYGYESHGHERTNPAVLLALSCYLQSPCIAGHELGNFVPLQSSSPGYQTSEGPAVYESQYPLPTEQNQRYNRSPGEEALYTIARAETTYTLNPLIAQCPIASSVSGNSYDPNADTSVNITLGLPQCQREILYEAERVDEPPKYPQPMAQYQDGSLKGTLLKDQTTYTAPQLTVDGTKKIWKIRARFIYAMNRPPKPDEAVRTAVLPFTNITANETKITQNALASPQLAPGEPPQVPPP